MSVAACTLTATWQFARLPNAPQYWRAIPTDALPHSGNDTSSTTHTSGRQRPEHIGNELRQLTPDPFHIPQPRKGKAAHHQARSPDVTKHY